MRSAPLFYYGLCFLLGVSSHILFHPAYFVILALLFFLWKNRLATGILTAAIGFAFAAIAVTLPSLPEEGVQVKGTFIPESISYGHSPFGTSYVMKGSFSSAAYSRVPCQIYTPANKPRPPGNQHLRIEGKLLPKTFPIYVLKLAHYEPIPKTYSLAEWRFKIKDWARLQFKSMFSSQDTASFLLSMVTGEIDDRLMALQFNRLGLLHLLGVSGFQFSLLALLLGALLRMFLSPAKGTLLLIVLLTAYAFILGNSPPIQRAWVGTALYAIARLAGFQISPMNALGAALLWELLLDPCVFFQLGFQFSFLCTAAIFIVYPTIREFFMRWLPARTFGEARSLPLLDRVGYVFTFFCRETIALNIAIHLVSLPLIFFHFHKFPLLSLAYNLFLPALVSLAYLFLIPGILLHPIAHFLSYPFLKIAGLLTDGMLLVATSPPTLFDFQWRVPNFTLGWALLTLTLLILIFYERGRLLDRVFRR
jgi:competence protein ComEC